MIYHLLLSIVGCRLQGYMSGRGGCKQKVPAFAHMKLIVPKFELATP
jgi:hypothetical protein